MTALAAAALLLTACSRRDEVEAAAPIAAGSLPVVPVARAEYTALSHDLTLTAEFKPNQEIDVMAKVAGYVRQIPVDVGDRVKQGQLLAVIDVPEMADDLARAQASLQRYNAELVRSRDELERARSAHEMVDLSYKRLSAVMQSRPGLVAQQEVDDAHSRDLVAEAQIRSAQASLAASEEQVRVAEADLSRVKTMAFYTRVTAPFAGVVTKRYADTGSMVQAGVANNALPLVRLSENSTLRLILPVPESAVPAVHTGETVEVSVPTLHRTFAGKVARLTGRVQMSTRTMDTEVDVPNSSGLLLPGMYAEVVLKMDERAHALCVPVTAVSGGSAQGTVLLVESGRIQQRTVTLGMETPNSVEVRSGLSAGDLVVIGNRAQLRPGQAVKPKITGMSPAKSES